MWGNRLPSIDCLSRTSAFVVGYREVSLISTISRHGMQLGIHYKVAVEIGEDGFASDDDLEDVVAWVT